MDLKRCGEGKGEREKAKMDGGEGGEKGREVGEKLIIILYYTMVRGRPCNYWIRKLA